MNIGILIPGFSAHEHDWCIPVYLNMVRELAKEHYVRVFPIRYPFTTTPYEVFGAHVFPFAGGSYTARLQRWRILWQVERTLKRHHQNKPFDVLHAVWADETGHIANRVGMALGIPTVVSVAGGELVGFQNIGYGLQLGRVTRWLVYQALRYATQIVAPCLYTAQIVQGYGQHYGLKNLEERLAIVPLGIDPQLFTPPPQNASTRSREFLHVASLNPIKRQDVLLRLVARMPGAQLDIVGEGQLRKYLERLARELRIDNRVTFHGEVPHDQLPAFYQSAQHLLMTSQHEAYGMAALEAYACGMQVIGTDVGILPEIGRVAPFGDFQGFLKNIVGRSRNLTPENVAEQQQLVKQLYSVESMVKGLLNVYRAALNSPLPVMT